VKTRANTRENAGRGRVESLLSKIFASMILGTFLGLASALIHFSRQEWLLDPIASIRALLILAGSYFVLLLFPSLFLSWRSLRIFAVGVFALLQVAAFVYHDNPAPLVSQALWLLSFSIPLCILSILFSAWLLGPRSPRAWPIVIVALFACAGAVLAWKAPPDRFQTKVSKTQSSEGSDARAEQAKPSRRAPNLLLITLDTFRPDHLPAYGYRKVKTPHLDALAKDGVLFERTQVQAPLTSVSHASIFTSLYPPRHGVRAVTRSPTLSSKAVTLAELLHDAGYSTAAIVASAPLAPGSGLEKGFDVYDYVQPRGRPAFYGMRQAFMAKVLSRLQILPEVQAFRRGPEQTDRALAWLESHGDAPFFLWVHYFDAHDPYAPGWEAMKPELHPGTSWLDRFRRWYLYDSEVAVVDSQIGRLMDDLRQRGLEENTVIAVISDHGEGLGEHGYVGHSSRLFDEQLHAAFILRGSGSIPKGLRVPSQVREIDLMPTLLELLGLDRPQELQGSSLLPLLHGAGAQQDLLSLSETMQSLHSRLVSASDGRFKLIHALQTDAWTLYDLHQDPREKRDVAASRKSDLERLRKSILQYLNEAPPENCEPNPVDPELQMRLRSLGYVN
jgi:arylsulfatase A-like enzyme